MRESSFIPIHRRRAAPANASSTAADHEPAVARAEEFGHVVSWDPPAALTAARRWTCQCGATVIDYNGNIYGSAVEETCSGVQR